MTGSEIVFRERDEIEHLDQEIRKLRMHGLSYPEIAKELHVGLGRVQSRIHSMIARAELEPLPRGNKLGRARYAEEPYGEA